MFEAEAPETGASKRQAEASSSSSALLSRMLCASEFPLSACSDAKATSDSFQNGEAGRNPGHFLG
eukprot:6485146-Amphidinium_carterae.3